jgi:hypothetical protein
MRLLAPAGPAGFGIGFGHFVFRLPAVAYVDRWSALHVDIAPARTAFAQHKPTGAKAVSELQNIAGPLR